jgi:hypothetical protein
MADAVFEALAGRLRATPGVEAGTGFGAMPGLRVGGRIFAMLMQGDLVVKLPGARVAALLDEGAGRPLTMGTRTMREWVVVGPQHHDRWAALADEALGFVRPG